MLSRENRVVLVGFLAVALSLLAFFTYETYFDSAVGWRSLLVFVLFGIVGVAAPQLYLARTDSSVSPSARIRGTLVVLVFLALTTSPSVDLWESAAIWAITVLAGLLAIAYEFRSGYLAGAESDAGSSP